MRYRPTHPRHYLELRWFRRLTQLSRSTNIPTCPTQRSHILARTFNPLSIQGEPHKASDVRDLRSSSVGKKKEDSFWPTRPVITFPDPPPPLIRVIESRRQCESLFLQSMFCARSSRTRRSSVGSTADRPLPFLTPVAATLTETSKSHHACSAERTDQVTYRGDETRFGVCSYGKRSHKVSPCCVRPPSPNAQNLERGAAGAFLAGDARDRAAAFSLPDSHLTATELPHALLGTLPAHEEYQAAV